ncbi:hypothetical protein QF002_001152 [Paraburkholderia youngii]
MLRFVASTRRLARLRNLFTFCEAGVHQRIDENRMLVEMLQRDAGAFLATHPWVVQTLRSQDTFLCAIAQELPPAGGRPFVRDDTPAVPRERPALLDGAQSNPSRAPRCPSASWSGVVRQVYTPGD